LTFVAFNELKASEQQHQAKLLEIASSGKGNITFDPSATPNPVMNTYWKQFDY
tara:strand:+ start:5956 stop:6114 length:159 start_codon:yes stop_codon:yes gene_type:complete